MPQGSIRILGFSPPQSSVAPLSFSCFQTWRPDPIRFTSARHSDASQMVVPGQFPSGRFRNWSCWIDPATPARHEYRSALQGCGKLYLMSSVNEIEEAVLRLPAAELAEFRAWFAEFDAEAWDRRIEDDVALGRLDALADGALQDLRAGRCTER